MAVSSAPFLPRTLLASLTFIRPSFPSSTVQSWDFVITPTFVTGPASSFAKPTASPTNAVPAVVIGVATKLPFPSPRSTESARFCETVTM